jgi:uncharacterized membrane protein
MKITYALLFALCIIVVASVEYKSHSKHKSHSGLRSSHLLKERLAKRIHKTAETSHAHVALAKSSVAHKSTKKAMN